MIDDDALRAATRGELNQFIKGCLVRVSRLENVKFASSLREAERMAATIAMNELQDRKKRKIQAMFDKAEEKARRKRG